MDKSLEFIKFKDREAGENAAEFSVGSWGRCLLFVMDNDPAKAGAVLHIADIKKLRKWLKEWLAENEEIIDDEPFHDY